MAVTSIDATAIFMYLFAFLLASETIADKCQ